MFSTSRQRSRLVVALSLLVACGATSRAIAEDAPTTTRARPNIVLILADDLGYSDLGCYGGEIETPNLDALAAGGLRFTQFTNAARCCPTRAALLTGLYPHRAGVGHMVADQGYPGYQGYLNDRSVTIAEALRPAGYATLLAGKWHVGTAEDRWPRRRGFDRFFGTPTGGGVYFQEAADQFRPEVIFVADDEPTRLEPGAYVTDVFTDHAVSFAEQAVEEGRPFFLYAAYFAPHWPLQALPEDIARYEGRYDIGWDAVRAARDARQRALGLIPDRWALSPRDPEAQPWDETDPATRADLAHRMAVYAAQVDRLDQNVGRLVEALERLGILDDTLILFLSDNGCSAEGGPGGFRRDDGTPAIGGADSYASAGLEWANVCDTPFRKFKMSTHEGGISTPLIAQWPNGIARRGEFEPQVGHVIDLLPTILDVAGAGFPTERNGQPTLRPDGRSLVPALNGRTFPREPIFWEHRGNRAVRAGKWKLVAPHDQPWELYDLDNDRTEQHDLAGTMPEKVAELAATWQAWADSANVLPWPVRRPERR